MKGKEIIFLSGISKLETNEERWNPFPWYREMREHNPIFFDEEQQVWNVFAMKTSSGYSVIIKSLPVSGNAA